MEFAAIDEAVRWLEKANASLEPEQLTREGAREALARYARARKLVDFGTAALSRKLDDPSEIAETTGTWVGRAKAMLETGKVMKDSEDLSSALKDGEISLEQASEIAKAEQASPGVASELVEYAKRKSLQELTSETRRRRLDAEQHKGLAERQREARRARARTGDLGMIHLEIALEPLVGAPIVARAEAEAARLYRAAKKDGKQEPFERHLADAYAAMLSGSGVKGPSMRPELVILVSHEVALRGWKDVRAGEVCKVPGVGPVPPAKAREIAEDAFLNALFYDGIDLRNFKRWTRNTPVEVRTALGLGKPPDFDGVKCVDCGRRFGIENDHVEPHVAKGPASTTNLDGRCWPCHLAKTERDRRAGKLKPPEPGERGDPTGSERHAGPGSERRAGKLEPPDP